MTRKNRTNIDFSLKHSFMFMLLRGFVSFFAFSDTKTNNEQYTHGESPSVTGRVCVCL